MPRTKTDINIEDVLKRIENGESQADIAAAYGVDAAIISRLLNKDDDISQRSARAREASAEAWLDKGYQNIMDATDAVGVAKARLIAQECARRAAIRNPAYRDKQQLEHSGPNGGAIPTSLTVEFVKAE